MEPPWQLGEVWEIGEGVCGHAAAGAAEVAAVSAPAAVAAAVAVGLLLPGRALAVVVGLGPVACVVAAAAGDWALLATAVGDHSSGDRCEHAVSVGGNAMK